MKRSNQKPHVRVIECLGGTGNGKTEFSTIPAAPEARKVLIRGIGNTNSTLTERLMVYTEEYTDKIVVAVKHNDEAFSRNDLTEIISKVLAVAAKETGKTLEGSEETDIETLKTALREELAQKNNIKAMLSLLTQEQMEQFIQKVLSLYRKYMSHKDLCGIYGSAGSELSDTEVKKNSKKFFAAVQMEAAKRLDGQPAEFKTEFWQIWEELNRNLSDAFFSYFDRDDVSPDGYYCKDIDLNHPDMDFIEAMFTQNELRNGGRLSLEVLCREIVLYVPINPVFKKMISENPHTDSLFRDSNGHIVFGNLDTRGLYHADMTNEENTDYCSELLYKGDVDGIAIIVPLMGDTNEKKASAAYRDALKGYAREVPIFLVHNKVDMFVDSIMKDCFDDPLSIELSESEPLSSEDIRARIQKRMDALDEEFRVEQTKAKKRRESIPSLPCYLKRDNRFPQELAKEYNPLTVYETILSSIATTLESSANKVRFCIEQGEVPTPTVNRAKLFELVQAHIQESETAKRVFAPGSSDLILNMGKTPHGNAYHALRRRIKNGEGYTSNIDASYYYNCQSFSIKFTANIRNFAPREFLRLAVLQTLSVEGASCPPEAKEAYLEQVVNYMDPKKLVSILLFDHAMQKAETEFSFGRKFQKFLENSMPYLRSGAINAQAYADAIETIILEAANKALDLNVTFR